MVFLNGTWKQPNCSLANGFTMYLKMKMNYLLFGRVQFRGFTPQINETANLAVFFSPFYNASDTTISSNVVLNNISSGSRNIQFNFYNDSNSDNFDLNPFSLNIAIGQAVTKSFQFGFSLKLVFVKNGSLVPVSGTKTH